MGYGDLCHINDLELRVSELERIVQDLKKQVEKSFWAGTEVLLHKDAAEPLNITIGDGVQSFTSLVPPRPLNDETNSSGPD